VVVEGYARDDEPFVGIEVDGRYIRIFGDDTA